MIEMTETLKEGIIADYIYARHHSGISHETAEREAREVIRLVRALDSYRERDSKGRFISKNEPSGQG